MTGFGGPRGFRRGPGFGSPLSNEHCGAAWHRDHPEHDQKENGSKEGGPGKEGDEKKAGQDSDASGGALLRHSSSGGSGGFGRGGGFYGGPGSFRGGTPLAPLPDVRLSLYKNVGSGPSWTLPKKSRTVLSRRVQP